MTPLPEIQKEPFKAIFLVGGNGSGRKTAAKILSEQGAIRPIVVDSFHYELRERCHAAWKLFDASRLPAAANYFEDRLDEPCDLFHGCSPRNAYLKFQRFVHDAMGHAAMGEWVVERLTYYRSLQAERLKKGQVPPDRIVRGVILYDDAPASAYREVVKYLGAENCVAVTIRRQGVLSLPIELPGVRQYEVTNSGDTVSAFNSAFCRSVPHLFIETFTQCPK